MATPFTVTAGDNSRKPRTTGRQGPATA